MRKKSSIILVSVLSLSVVTFALILPVYSSNGRNQPSNALGIPQQPQVRQTVELPEDAVALVYTDDADLPASERYPIVALDNLGITYVHYADDYDGFRTALLSQTWDLVVVSHNTDYAFGDNWTELEQYVFDGGRLVLTTFDIDGSHSEPTTLWATLGVEYRSDMSVPEPVYRWEPTHPIFTDPNTVGDLTVCGDEYSDDGDHVAVTTGTALAGFTTTPAADDAAIVEANGGNTVLMSFLLCEFDGDEDSDGKLDAVELWENAITCVPGPAGLYAGGSAPGVVYRYLDGTSWQTVSPELGHAVLCLYEYDEHLYAGTRSTESDPFTGVGRVWRYEGGTTWTLVGDNMDNQVCALIVFRGDLYAGTGWAGGRLYRYEGGTTWTRVVDYGGWNGFRCLYVWNDIMYIGDVGMDYFGHYDGTDFTWDADLGGSCIWDFEVYNNALYASALNGRIHRSFDGTTWSTIRDSQDNDSWELETFQDYLYVSTGPNLETYDGAGFSLVWTEPGGYEIISMIRSENSLIIGVGEEAGYRGQIAGRVYTHDGTQVQLISANMGSGIQALSGDLGVPPIPAECDFIAAYRGADMWTGMVKCNYGRMGAENDSGFWWSPYSEVYSSALWDGSIIIGNDPSNLAFYGGTNDPPGELYPDTGMAYDFYYKDGYVLANNSLGAVGVNVVTTSYRHNRGLNLDIDMTAVAFDDTVRYGAGNGVWQTYKITNTGMDPILDLRFSVWQDWNIFDYNSNITKSDADLGLIWQYDIAEPDTAFGCMILPAGGVYADRAFGPRHDVYIYPNAGWGWDRDTLWNLMNGPDHDEFYNETEEEAYDHSTTITTDAFDLAPGDSVNVLTWSGEAAVPQPMGQFLCADLKFAGFYRGDANNDGRLNAIDVCYLTAYLFKAGPPPKPFADQGDVNADGYVTPFDLVYLMQYFCLGGPAPIDYPRFPAEIPFDPQPSLFTQPGFNDLCQPFPPPCGDGNGDGKVELADVVYLINYVYKSGPAPIGFCDVNCNCEFFSGGQYTCPVDPADIVYLINYLFKAGPEPCAGCPY